MGVVRFRQYVSPLKEDLCMKMWGNIQILKQKYMEFLFAKQFMRLNFE